jgi:hypothetical protein
MTKEQKKSGETSKQRRLLRCFSCALRISSTSAYRHLSELPATPSPSPIRQRRTAAVHACMCQMSTPTFDQFLLPTGSTPGELTVRAPRRAWVPRL